ncbi:MAG: sulfatase-like hydrolase/transferase [Rhodothermaceae bacterium]|nr:sulfatase-like hydrolase/transferase [Rhodothermaceae bacterium]
MRRLHLIALAVFLLTSISCQPEEVDRPNILWITAEDMSPVLGYLGDEYAITPNLDKLAGESVIYTQAFATAPVCSPSRAALINGITAPAQGAHQMRSAFPLPNEWVGFPALLREAGYYTTNNVKTDYNSGHAAAIIDASLDENSDTAGWWGREEGESFFAIFNHMVSHQSRSMVWPYEQFVREVQSQLDPDQIHDPATAPVPPYYPDTPIIRKTLARFYDCVTVMDKQVGEILQRLEADGLMDDTIIFFYSDHGSGLPRHKRAILDTGMHVPLLVRFPEKYQHLAPAEPGSRLDRLVSFDDFGPSVLSLVGIDIPAYMQGEPFLGDQATPPREFVYGHRDRIDEAMDMSRSVRDHEYLYVRHYMPHMSYNQQTAWPDQGEIRHEFYQLAVGGNMTPNQRHFAGPAKPLEELYDVQADPMNLNNLVEHADHQDVLDRMRGALREQLIAQRDLGFVPELEMLRYTDGTTPQAWAQTNAYNIEAYMSAAEAVGSDDFERLRDALGSSIEGVRYWGAMGYMAAPSLLAADLIPLLGALNDEASSVQIQAASALIKHGHQEEGLPVLRNLLRHEDPNVVMYAARAVELAGEDALPAYDDMQGLYDAYKDRTDDPYLFIGFAAKGYLDRVVP